MSSHTEGFPSQEWKWLLFVTNTHSWNGNTLWSYLRWGSWLLIIWGEKRFGQVPSPFLTPQKMILSLATLRLVDEPESSGLPKSWGDQSWAHLKPMCGTPVRLLAWSTTPVQGHVIMEAFQVKGVSVSIQYGCCEEEWHVRIIRQRVCLLKQKFLNWLETLKIHGQETVNIINCISQSKKPSPRRSTWYKRVKGTRVLWLPVWQCTFKRHRNEETYSLSLKRSAFWSENCTWLNEY